MGHLKTVTVATRKWVATEIQEEVLGRPVVYKGNLQENFVHGREKRP